MAKKTRTRLSLLRAARVYMRFSLSLSLSRAVSVRARAYTSLSEGSRGDDEKGVGEARLVRSLLPLSFCRGINWQRVFV